MADAMIARLRRGSSLDEEAARALQGLSWDIHVIANGRNVIREGDRSDKIYLIVEGWAARYTSLRDGTRQITAVLLPGDLSDIHTTSHINMDHGIVALTALRVAHISPAMLGHLIDSRADVERALRWSTFVDESVLRAWMVNIGRRDARSRVAHLFCELNDRLGPDGYGNGRFAAMPLTQVELGDVLGLTSIHVNRVLKGLRNDDIIATARGELQILDLAMLQRIGDFNAHYLHKTTRFAPSVASLVPSPNVHALLPKDSASAVD